MKEKVTITTEYYYELLKKESILDEFEEWAKSNDDSYAVKYKSEVYGIPIEIKLITYDFLLIKLKELRRKYNL